MSDHFSTMGFDVPSLEALKDLARRIIADARTECITVRRGRYFHWTGTAGEDLWVSANSKGALVGFYPHFSGKSKVLVGLESRIVRDGAPPFDGAFQAWAEPESDKPGLFRFVFDVPDGALCERLKLPSMAEARIAALAYEIAAYESADDYYAAQADAEAIFAAESFVPFGMFLTEGDTKQQPSADARIAGRVLESALLRNSMSGLSYYWALVETIGGTFDMVIDHGLLQDVPSVGGILSGTFWLSGRLTLLHGRRRSWLGRRLVYVQAHKTDFAPAPNAGRSLMEPSGGTKKPWWKRWR